MEASALRHAARVPVLTGLSPHLRLQSDERLVALVRRGHQGAFEVLLRRYQPRLLAFCRHMLASNEDAEDVLQEVFAAAYKAICADDRPINARPWLYRIARNRCLNHLRRPTDAGQESMDVFEREAGATAADTVHRREEFRQIVADVHELPESQRTALLLREIDTLSYDQIAEAMETTVPSVKSLLVRARLSLAEASEARRLTCAEVRLELSQSAEGIGKPSSPTRRHVRSCQRCRGFKRELRRTSHALAAISPLGPAVALKALLGGGTATAGKGAASGTTVAGGAALAGGGAAGALSAAGGSVVTKAAAGLVAAAVVAMGAVEVKQVAGGEERVTSALPADAEPVDEGKRPPPPAKPAQATRQAEPVRAAGPIHAEPTQQAAAGPVEEARANPGAPDADAPRAPEAPAADQPAPEDGAPPAGGEEVPVVPPDDAGAPQGGSSDGEDTAGEPVTEPPPDDSSPTNTAEEPGSTDPSGDGASGDLAAEPAVAP